MLPSITFTILVLSLATNTITALDTTDTAPTTSSSTGAWTGQSSPSGVSRVAQIACSDSSQCIGGCCINGFCMNPGGLQGSICIFIERDEVSSPTAIQARSIITTLMPLSTARPDHFTGTHSIGDNSFANGRFHVSAGLVPSDNILSSTNNQIPSSFSTIPTSSPRPTQLEAFSSAVSSIVIHPIPITSTYAYHDLRARDDAPNDDFQCIPCAESSQCLGACCVDGCCMSPKLGRRGNCNFGLAELQEGATTTIS